MDSKKEVLLTKVYSKPNCVQCKATIRELDKKNVSYDYIDLYEEPDRISEISSLGYLQAPVVVTEDAHWSGFRLDLINKHLAD